MSSEITVKYGTIVECQMIVATVDGRQNVWCDMFHHANGNVMTIKAAKADGYINPQWPWVKLQSDPIHVREVSA